MLCLFDSGTFECTDYAFERTHTHASIWRTHTLTDGACFEAPVILMFVVQTEMAGRYLQYVCTLSHIIQGSTHSSTDAVLHVLSANPHAMIQVTSCLHFECFAEHLVQLCWTMWQMLLVYTPFNVLNIGVAQLWPKRQEFADLWFSQASYCKHGMHVCVHAW